MTIFIASDHGGFELKKELIKGLSKEGLNVVDMGPKMLKPEDDYPDYVVPTMKKVQETTDSKGILICRNGVGVSMLANKFNNIRAVLSWDEKHVSSSRNDDDTNVLALPSDYITGEKALKIVLTWLKTPFSNKEKHIKRLRKISNIEKDPETISSLNTLS